jgi:hypothetical protein
MEAHYKGSIFRSSGRHEEHQICVLGSTPPREVESVRLFNILISKHSIFNLWNMLFVGVFGIYVIVLPHFWRYLLEASAWLQIGHYSTWMIYPQFLVRDH